MTDGPVPIELEVERPRGAVIPVTRALAGAGTIMWSKSCYLLGWALVETSGSASAEVDIYDGLSSASTLVAPITLSSGQSTRDYLGPDGLWCQVGVFAALASGAAKLVVWVRDIP